MSILAPNLTSFHLRYLRGMGWGQLWELASRCGRVFEKLKRTGGGGLEHLFQTPPASGVGLQRQAAHGCTTYPC